MHVHRRAEYLAARFAVNCREIGTITAVLGYGKNEEWRSSLLYSTALQELSLVISRDHFPATSRFLRFSQASGTPTYMWLPLTSAEKTVVRSRTWTFVITTGKQHPKARPIRLSSPSQTWRSSRVDAHICGTEIHLSWINVARCHSPAEIEVKDATFLDRNG